MVAQTLQNSKQILIDMKNIYEFKDIMELSKNSSYPSIARNNR